MAYEIKDVAAGMQWLEHDLGEGPIKCARPEHLAKHPAKLFELHEELRDKLMQAIRQQDTVEIASLVDRGAPLLPHYTSSRFDEPSDARPAGYFTSKGAHSSLINPVDWAALEHHFAPAKLLLKLSDNQVVFTRDERSSYLTKLDLARQTKRAVFVTAQQCELELLEMLLHRRADPAQANGFGETALLVAVRDGKEQSAEMLLRYGAWEAEPRKHEVLERATARRLSCVLRAAGTEAKVGSQGRAEDTAADRPPAWDSLVSELARHSSEEDRRLQLSLMLERGATGGATTTKCQLRPGSSRAVHAPVAAPPLAPELPRTRAEVRTEDAEQRAALRGAIKKGCAAEVRSRVCLGAPFDGLYDLGCGIHGSCVDWACVSEQPSTAMLLLELAEGSGCSAELVAASRVAVSYAVLHGYPEVLQSLLSLGASAGRSEAQGPSGDGDSPLGLAISSWRGREAAVLLRHGAWDLEPESRRAEMLEAARTRKGVAEAFHEAGLL